jgi:2-pyrone-4,6-dicarboxylate lactonase
MFHDAFGAPGSGMTRPCPGPDPTTKPPRFVPPPGAWDCHAHVFGPPETYPFVEARSFTPPTATVRDWLRVLDTLGLARGVLVQGSAHGTDNRVTLDAIAASNGRALGVAVVGPDTTDAELAALHAGGMRGARLSSVVAGGPGLAVIDQVAARIRPLGWHLVVHVARSAELVGLLPHLLAAGLPLVIDHLGHALPEEGEDAPGITTLLELLRLGHWTKISALHRPSPGPAPWTDVKPLVRRVLRVRPDRVLWGTDWPHVNHYGAMPNDGDLMDAFADWVPETALQRAVLVDNPRHLYLAKPD